jgi:hypothetical protein
MSLHSKFAASKLLTNNCILAIYASNLVFFSSVGMCLWMIYFTKFLVKKK